MSFDQLKQMGSKIDVNSVSPEGLKNMADDLKNKMQGELMNQAQAQLGQLTGHLDKIKQIGMTADSFFSSGVNVAKSVFGETAGNYLDPDLKMNTKVGNFSEDLTEKLDEFSKNLENTTKTLAANAANMKSEALGFVASTTKKLLEPITSVIDDVAGDLASGLEELGAGQLGRLASFGSDALASLEGGLSAITGGLSEAFSEGLGALDSLSSIGDAVSGIIEPALDIVDIASTITDPRYLGSLVSSNLDFLPNDLQNLVGNIVTKQAENLLGDTSEQLKAILDIESSVSGLFNGSVSLGDALDDVLSFGGSSVSGLLNGQGLSIPGLSGYTGSSGDLDRLVNAVKTLCGDSDLLDISGTNQGDMENLFDLLLKKAMDTGAGSIVEALLNCGSSNQYKTSRSTAIMRNSLPSVVSSGNVDLYATIVKNTTLDVTTDAKKDVLSLMASANYNEHNTSKLQEVMDIVGVTEEDLVTSKTIGTHQVLDAGAMTVLQLGDSRYRESILPSTTFDAINTALHLYA